MSDLVVIFRTRSDVEASIVRGLLESHGILSVQSSGLPPSIFPMAVNPLGDGSVSAYFTATATNVAGSTSEFSAPIALAH